ncbi:ester cyclase [Tunturiibacter lichenicola]|uniref:ester cyclase n=1 Tax=Tunturiibacter lichenicola TaxID=2051959 RepID=UPI0021B2AF70|nr:ester cyclase [Edaphobacter lichenicola]
MSTTENNKAVIGRFIEEVINQNRMNRADDLTVEDFVELDPFPGQRQGREGLKEVLGMMRTAFPDIHWVVDKMVAEGDTVVTGFSWTGTHRGALLGVPATRRNVTVKGVVIDQLANGKMNKSRLLMDRYGDDAAAWGGAVCVVVLSGSSFEGLLQRLPAAESVFVDLHVDALASKLYAFHAEAKTLFGCGFAS